MGKIAFLFPGQGSQQAGMGLELSEMDTDVKARFEEADSALGEKLSSLIFEGPQDKLTHTANAQPALLATSIAILEHFRKSGIEPDFVAGHSLGEYSALVAAGAFSFNEAVRTVRQRGELMEAAVPEGQGTMAAVLGLDRERLSEVCRSVSGTGDVAELANLNCPGQIVISGSRKGVEAASVLAKEAGAKRVLPLDVSGPFHSSLMKPAASDLEKVLGKMDIRNAEIPVIANVSAKPMLVAHDIKQNLIEQLYSPVLWEDSVKKMIDEGVDTFIEIGPGKVLTGLVKKVDRSAKAFSVFDRQSHLAAVAALKGDEQE